MGKSGYTETEGIEETDHPHVRGEKRLLPPSHEAMFGSSPRAWGKVGGGILTSAVTRIIPTCVGKSVVSVCFIVFPPDHPHVRGEKAMICSLFMPSYGSSPRAWGKEAFGGRHEEEERIIPTCVGKRTVCRSTLCRIPDHPHVRGEKMWMCQP